jgi:hypothetical protein
LSNRTVTSPEEKAAELQALPRVHHASSSRS